MKKLLSLILLCLLIGCQPAVLEPIVVGTNAVINTIVYWKEGEATAYFNYNSEIMHKATTRALKKLDIKIKEDSLVPPKKTKRNKTPGYYVVGTSNDRFKIKITSIEKNITKVAIRINYTGDKEYAKLIFATIDDQINVIEFK